MGPVGTANALRPFSKGPVIEGGQNAPDDALVGPGLTDTPCVGDQSEPGGRRANDFWSRMAPMREWSCRGPARRETSVTAARSPLRMCSIALRVSFSPARSR